MFADIAAKMAFGRPRVHKTESLTATERALQSSATDRERPILAICGTPEDRLAWDPIWRLLVTNHRFDAHSLWLDAEDRQRVLKHRCPRKTPAADFIALAQALTRESGSPIHVLGWLEGGDIALRAVLQAPNLFRSLTLFDPRISEILNHIAEGSSIEADFFRDPADTKKSLPIRIPEPVLPAPPAINVATLSALEIDALLMTGEASHPRDQIAVEWLAAHLPNATERVWRENGRKGLFENPEIIANEIAAFLVAT
ncbi:hypothetical protein EOI86_00500 [Hwanghaeella grinnelliae]|uniref:Alpha/beta hydrolase n=1 Tax=Hwanghaeella grinnelliae TaxID=2500179 RepID=A0A437QTJ8_9PROT|nr:hypothetical protein [Hwanghaeella grinnelliae]RVU37820.1 hypothetical protein EOI86_00500 [Hwanghaeella grinnelliae]